MKPDEAKTLKEISMMLYDTWMNIDEYRESRDQDNESKEFRAVMEQIEEINAGLFELSSDIDEVLEH